MNVSEKHAVSIFRAEVNIFCEDDRLMQLA
jgi:hypothetical protein